jgi:hypothetical protein
MLHYKPQAFSSHEAAGHEFAPLNRKARTGKKAGSAANERNLICHKIGVSVEFAPVPPIGKVRGSRSKLDA